MTRPGGTTGTVYGLVDPRDSEIRYVGATVKTLAHRLRGHLGSTTKKIREWVAELQAAGLAPQIVALRENVPAGELSAAEDAEITRILAAGGALLNEASTARGRGLNRQRREVERVAAERAGWREFADSALVLFGGPLPPGELPEIEIPEMDPRLASVIRDPVDAREKAGEHLWRRARRAWPVLRGLADGHHHRWDFRMERYFIAASEMPAPNAAVTARHLALIVWYMVAVDPWWHLAQLAGIATDVAAFTGWAGRRDETREALEFLVARGTPRLAGLADDREDGRYHCGPGHLLALAAAAHAKVTPADAIRATVVRHLAKLADDRELTPPMADLLESLDPKALDTAYGPDVAAKVDEEMGLLPGTSGRVLRAIMAHLRVEPRDQVIRQAVARSAQEFSVKALPDYKSWEGPGVVGSRIVGAHLVQAGLATPDYDTPADYLASVRALWVPDVEWQRRSAA